MTFIPGFLASGSLPLKTADGAVHFPSGMTIHADGTIALPGRPHKLISRDFFQSQPSTPSQPTAPDSVWNFAGLSH